MPRWAKRGSFCLRLPLLALLLALAPSGRADQRDDFLQAMEGLFTLESGASGVGGCLPCEARLRNLMLRAKIPQTAEELRNLSNKELIGVGLRAAIGEISDWKRDTKDTSKLYLTQMGVTIPRHMVSELESNVMLCVICVLIGAIAATHAGQMRCAKPGDAKLMKS